MASFEKAVEVTLKHEGGLTKDTGGLTNYGISQNAYPEVDIKGLTRDDAKAIYRRDYWDRIHGDEIASQPAAGILFDFAVNAGISRAVKEAQRTLVSMGKAVAIDGKPGAGFLAAINSAGPVFPQAFSEARIAFYKGLADNDPAKYGKYLAGWVKRAKSFFDSGSMERAAVSLAYNPIAWALGLGYLAAFMYYRKRGNQ